MGGNVEESVDGRAEAELHLELSGGGDTAEGASVEGTIESHDFMASAWCAVPAGEFVESFVGFGTAVAEKDFPGESDERDEAGGEFGLRAGEEKIRGMDERGGLCGEGLLQGGVGMAEGVDGDAGGEVEVGAVVFVPDAGAFAAAELEGEAGVGRQDVLRVKFGGGRRRRARGHGRCDVKERARGGKRTAGAGRLTAGGGAVCMSGMWLKVLRAALYGLVVLTLAGVAFVAGVITAKKMAEPLPPIQVEEVPAADRAAARDFLEEALAARFAGEHRGALAKLEEARQRNAGLRGLDYQFALTYLDLEDYAAAEESARRSVDKDEETGNAQALRGMILLAQARATGTVGAQGPEILARLQESRGTDPLNPMPLYAMAEFYRADGKPELAVDAYRRALERVSKTDSFLVTTVKAGLAGLRLNYRDGDPPLKLQDINGVLPPEQLFFGAADALLRGDNEAAVGYLQEVRTRMPKEVFQALLQDSFFQDYLPTNILNDPRSPLPQP